MSNNVSLLEWLNDNLDTAEEWFHVPSGYKTIQPVYERVCEITGRHVHPEIIEDIIRQSNCPSAITYRRQCAIEAIQRIAKENNLTVVIEDMGE